MALITLLLFLLSLHQRVHTHVAVRLLLKCALPRSEHPELLQRNDVVAQVDEMMGRDARGQR